jgi:hypothetical protein
MPTAFHNSPSTRNARALIALFVAALVLAHLAWQWAHGGIVSHHLLADPDLPAVSNAWGIVALPALAWLLSGRFLRRATSSRAARSVLIAAIGSAAAGICLSLAFSFGATDHASLVLLAILLCGIALPIHRAECLFGFVLAMAWTFGPILPILMGSVIVLFSVAVRRVVWPALAWARSRLRT